MLFFARKRLNNGLCFIRLRLRKTPLLSRSSEGARIARALSYDPDIILEDEPTGNLDADTQNEIMAIFRDMTDQGKCVIPVSHSPDVAEKCDERYELIKISGKSKKKNDRS